ncbi:protein KRI1 homolog [Nephila pilipes]|uniref:Protein KRI1 homolog n=1 Tax=Nephila pilipes TaxID=299642 RepID=A0A8X6QWN3_NEPPI|nr:protein KRI1 homolog [Nephila pilipes]
MSKPLSLLSDSSDQESEVQFTINKGYAQRYDIWRKNEELQKLKDLDKDISETSSESEEEVEPVIEKDFFKTLSLLKSNDPRIYDKNYQFFSEEPIVKKPKEKKEKPMFMKDYERELVLKRNGVLSDEEDENRTSIKPITFQEQANIKKSFKDALRDFNDDDDDDLLQVHSKTNAEKEKDENDFKQWLESEKDLSYLNKYWNDPKLNDDEKFLRDYILNKKYIVEDEITEDIGLSEDEKTMEKQELFEHKYNFRFQEPDEEFIKSYPRTIGDSLRRANTKRKQKREEYAERKKREKEQKREELKRLKALKRKEIEERFLKLKEVSGQDELNFNESDMESDFDPNKHDQKMRELFNKDYYNIEEVQKPEFNFDEEIDNEDWDHWTREQIKYENNENKDEGEEESSNAEEDEPKHDSKAEFEREMIESTMPKKKKGYKKSLFAKIVAKPKPLFDPDGKSFEDYLDEYYRMDYEDIIGDMPVRFKYRKVISNDFGLSIDEILSAKDQELNQWCSVKKTFLYRPDDQEKSDIYAYRRKAQNFEAKKKILHSVYSQPEEIAKMPAETSKTNENATKKKRKRSKKKKPAKNCEEMKDSNHDDGVLPDAEAGYSEMVDKSSHKSKRKKKSSNLSVENGELKEELDLEKLERESVLVNDNEQQNHLLNDESHKSKRKKRKKKKSENSELKEELDLEKLKRENVLVNNEQQNSVLNDESSHDDIADKILKNSLKKTKETNSFSNSAGIEEIERNQNSNKKSKKRKFDSLEVNDSFTSFSKNESVSDDSEVKDNQNNIKKNKRDITKETDSLSNEKLNNSNKTPQRNAEIKKEKTDLSYNEFSKQRNVSVSSPYARHFEGNNSFTSEPRNNQKFENNRESFGNFQRNNSFNFCPKNKHTKFNSQQPFEQKPFSQKRKFHNSNFNSDSRARISDNSEMVLNSYGKKIVSSNRRLEAFHINPKRLSGKLKYGKQK